MAEPLKYSNWRRYITDSIALKKWKRSSILNRLKSIEENPDFSERILNYPGYVAKFLKEVDIVLPEIKEEEEEMESNKEAPTFDFKKVPRSGLGETDYVNKKVENTKGMRLPKTQNTVKSNPFERQEVCKKESGGCCEGFTLTDIGKAAISIAVAILSVSAGLFIGKGIVYLLTKFTFPTSFYANLKGIREHVKGLTQQNLNIGVTPNVS